MVPALIQLTSLIKMVLLLKSTLLIVNLSIEWHNALVEEFQFSVEGIDCLQSLDNGVDYLEVMLAVFTIQIDLETWQQTWK